MAIHRDPPGKRNTGPGGQPEQLTKSEDVGYDEYIDPEAR
jgi:hypothetical protein